MICSCAGLPAAARSSQSRQASRLVVVAGVHQREQRQRGVAQPAVAVVPVARAAELLRQRRRGRRDDAAGGRVGQRLERDQRAHHGLVPFAVRLRRARPLAPERLGVRRATHPDRSASRRRPMRRRRSVSTNGTVSPAATSNSPTVVQVLAVQRHRRAQHDHVRSGDRAQRAVVEPADPRHDRAVVEAEHQLHAHPHASALAAHQADDVGVAGRAAA